MRMRWQYTDHRNILYLGRGIYFTKYYNVGGEGGMAAGEKNENSRCGEEGKKA